MSKNYQKNKQFFAFLKKEPIRIATSLCLFIPGFVLDKCGIAILSMIFCLAALACAGIPVLASAIKGILRGDLLDEKFLMSVASIGAVVLGEYTEAATVMIFYLIGEYFEHRAVRRSRGAIRSLMDIRPDEATLLQDGREERVDAEDVAVGSVIVIRSGERVPIDCVILSGSADVDTSALTGESIPRSVSPSDALDSGVVILSGVLICKTLRPAEESAAARVLALVENANERKSKEENFITAFSHFYTPAVVAGAFLLALIPPIFGMPWSESIRRALIFLVVSCPCALVISVPLAFFGGIGCAASRGILYKGGNTFSAVSSAKIVAFDKTGTLTSGEFVVSEIFPVGIPKEELLDLAASAEYGSNHPIALCIKRAAGTASQIPAASREIAGKGTIATVRGRQIAVGNLALMREVGAAVPEERRSGAGMIHVADGERFLGAIVLSDRVKPEAKDAIASLRALGVRKTVILSGDRCENVEQVRQALGIDEAVAELLPTEKFARLESLIESGAGKTVYVGDGINDAPSLARADVGVAMGAIGSDSAIEAADLVVMSDRLDQLPEAIRIARRTLRIAKENIAFAISVKLAILVLGALGLANMWLAVFADVGVAVLAILNSMRTLAYRK